MKDTRGVGKVAFNYEGITETWRQAEGWKASGDVLPVRDLAFPAGITLADGTPVQGIRLMPYPADAAMNHGASDNRPCAIHLLEPDNRKATGKIIVLLPEGEFHAEAAYNALLVAMQIEAPEDFTGEVGEALPTEGWYATYSLVDAETAFRQDSLRNDSPGNDAVEHDFSELVELEYIRSGAAAASEIFAVYLSLSEVEKDRVYHFTMDAKHRDTSQSLIDYKPIESFIGFLEEVAQGKSVEQVCRELELTPLEYQLLSWNWETLRWIETAVQRRVQERYGKATLL